MEQTVNANLNSAQCIQTAMSFGYTTYTNICSGAVHVVQWGSVDYLIGITITSIFGIMILGFLAFVAWCIFGD